MEKVAVSPELSVVVPALNEEGGLAQLNARLFAVLDTLGASFEVVYVDDGSVDSTWAVIERLADADDRVRGVSFSRNFGHQAAILAGLSIAQGRAVVTMDADLQHPPETLPSLVAAWREGAKVVDTKRLDSAVAGPLKRLSSALFYRVFSRLTGVELSEGTSDFRLLDRAVVEEILKMREPDLFLRGLVSWLGFSRRVIPYEAGRRFEGKPKYTLRRMVGLAAGGLVSFSRAGMVGGIYVGSAVCLASLLFALWLLAKALCGAPPESWLWAFSALAFLDGMILAALGFFGRHFAAMKRSAHGWPIFVVERATKARQAG